MAESAEQRAIREAEEACQHAIASTPEQYRGFILLLSQNKRVGGSRQNPSYATIRQPYMTVDGRVKWARDEHVSSGHMLDFDPPQFIKIFDQTVCQVTVTSSLHGKVTATAEVRLGGSGVDANSPISNGETSAIGRALGMLGYGVYGNGIASANEVLSAMAADERQRIEGMSRPVAMPKQAEKAVDMLFGEQEPKTLGEFERLQKQRLQDAIDLGMDREKIEKLHSQEWEAFVLEPVAPATEKHLGVLFGALKKCGVKDGHKRTLVERYLKVPSNQINKDVVTDLIKSIDYQGHIPPSMFTSYIQLLLEGSSISKDELARRMIERFQTANTNKLNADQQREVMSWFAEPESSDESDQVPTDEWIALIKDICSKHDLSSTQVSSWIIDAFGPDGGVDDVTRLGVDVYNTVKDMYDGDRLFIANLNEELAEETSD